MSLPPHYLVTTLVPEVSDQASSGESMILATQADPISVPSQSTPVPAPAASQVCRDLKEIRVAEALLTFREGPSTIQLSQHLDTVLSPDPEIVLPRQSVQVGHLPYELHCDPNSTTLPMHSTPGIGTSGIETHSADSFASTQFISPVFGIPPVPQPASGQGHITHLQPEPLQAYETRAIAHLNLSAASFKCKT